MGLVYEAARARRRVGLCRQQTRQHTRDQHTCHQIPPHTPPPTNNQTPPYTSPPTHAVTHKMARAPLPVRALFNAAFKAKLFLLRAGVPHW